MKRNTYEIEITPYKGLRSGFFHVAVVNSYGFVFCTARASMFDAVAAGFGVARKFSRAKSFSVRVVA